MELDYTDLAENKATTYTADFVIDKTIAKAKDVTIEYTKSLVDKILEGITFGFYQSNVEVKVTVKDQTAGIEYFEITYTQADGKNNSNQATYTTEKLTAVQDETDKNVFTATHTISAQARGTVSVELIDKAGNTTDRSDDYVVVADTIVPGLEYKWEFTDDQVREYNGIYYTQDAAEVEFTIEETNFDLSLIQATGPAGEEETAAPAPVLTVNGVAQEIDWVQLEGTDKWYMVHDGEAGFKISDNGDYVVELSYTDRSTNAMETYTQEIHIDNVAPKFDVTYECDVEARNENHYKADRKATIQVTEHNFKAEEVELTVTAQDITEAEVNISSKAYKEYAKNPENWLYKDVDGNYVKDVALAENADEHYLVLPVFDIDAIYSVELDYTDLAENKATTYIADFVIDKAKPSNTKIEYSESILNRVIGTITFGIYQPDVTVTVTAQDDTAGVEYFKITYTKSESVSSINRDTYTTAELVALRDTDKKNIFTAEHTIPANARGTVSVELLDKAGNGNGDTDSTVLVVDNLAPTREVIYTPYKVLDAATMLEVEDNKYQEGDDAILYYRNDAVVTFKITEANFDLSLSEEATKPVIKVNGVPVSVDWSQEGDVWTATHTISGDGDYVVTMTYTDLSTNEMLSYESCKIAIDSTAPIVNIQFEDGNPHQIIDGCKYYNNDQAVKIEVTEHNFRADDIIVKVTAEDIQGKEVDISAKQYSDYVKNRDNWTHSGDVHILKMGGIVFDIDAIYTFDIVYDDIADNFAVDYPQENFVIDHEAPTNLNIAYSIPVVGKIMEAITFRFYKPEVVVTLTADDITSGVDYFEWKYTQEDGTSTVNLPTMEEYTKLIPDAKDYSNAGKTATVTFSIPADARGYVTAVATDRAGNSSEKNDDTIINVVDQIAPKIAVEYVADDEETKVQFTNNMETVNTFADATNAYYNGDVTAKIVINEANFFEGVSVVDETTKISEVIHNVGIKLTKTDDNGNVTSYEYLPKDTVQKYTDAQPVYITWYSSGDEHSFSIPYTDSADYVLKIEYTDISGNDAEVSTDDGTTETKTYQSKVVTVDEILPVVTVEYGNKSVIQTVNGRTYFDAAQTATISIEEHNFRADDVNVIVTAKDITGTDVDMAVKAYEEYARDRRNWMHKNANGEYVTDAAQAVNANEYYIVLPVFDIDANYTFDVEFADMALNTAADYHEDSFSVDTIAPENLSITYSKPMGDMWEQILHAITFGYFPYQDSLVVTITADDGTSGVDYFEWKYTQEEGTSDTNMDTMTEVAKIVPTGTEYPAEGAAAKVEFTIPAQARGHIWAKAYDRSANASETDDFETINIVDNIAPTATITYNNPVQKVNDISYYSGNIDVKIVITEANFYSDDVVVRANDKTVTVKWVDDSADIHTGTFTLTEDGDYVITVEYTDRSTNVMAKYTSDRLTLDTKAPTVNTTNIKFNSANKDEQYGFTITADDINLDANSFKPVLTATVRNEDGSYGAKTVSLGEMKTIETGKTYCFTVDNLEEDAVYKLVCTVQDMSGNGYSQIMLEDNQVYDEVRFSINRNGSTFAVDEGTENLINQYYVYSVDEDVVIEEVNVDPVETYTVKLNGGLLNEGTDYTSTLSDKTGEWSKRTYRISKELFKDEGEYSIVIESTDKAETTAYSDVKNLNVSFAVDQTAPILTISGLEEGGRYQVEEQLVTVIPTDDGGRLNSIKVIVLNSDGEPLRDANGKDIGVRLEMAGEEFLDYLTENNGRITFTIPEGLENQVQIICNDCAVNADDETNEYNVTFTKVTVSQSIWIIFFANKPLFYGSVAGVLLIAAGMVFLALLKKRKNK